MEKLPFLRAAMAGLGKYHTGGYGRIGVYRVKRLYCISIPANTKRKYKVEQRFDYRNVRNQMWQQRCYYQKYNIVRFCLHNVAV